MEEKENGLSEIHLEIGKVRKNMGESLTDLQLEINELGEEIKILKEKINKKDFSDKSYIKEDIIKDRKKEIINEINFENLSKKDRIKKLILKGLTDEEICEKLKANKGEVLLIRGLIK